MSNSCVITPTVKVGNQERESKLFKSLLSLTNNRETTKTLWSLLQVPEVRSIMGEVATDENGEPTIEALDKLLNFDKLLEGDKSLFLERKELGAIDDKGNIKTYDKISSILNKVIDFNVSNPNLVADIVKGNDGYSITVEHKSLLNSDAPNKLMFRNNLNNQLLSLMRKLGFDVRVEDSAKYKGIFDPLNAETTAEGLKTVIRIAKGEEGEAAFPEEFSHLIISGLMNQPLVNRLVNMLKDDEVLKQVLEDEYDSYNKEYKGDKDRLAQEAAAKLLYQHIVNPQKESNNLLSRLWNWIKRIFRRLNPTDIDDVIRRVNTGLAKIADQIDDGSILTALDKDSIMKANTLYRLSREVNKMAEIANEAREVASKRMAILQSRSKGGKYSSEDVKTIKNLDSLIERKKYAKSCLAFLTDALSQIEDIYKDLSRLMRADLRSDSDLGKIRRISRTLRTIKEFSDGYEPIIRQMMALPNMKAHGEIEITDEDAEAISEKATEVFSVINSINSNYKQLRYDAVYNFLKIYWGEDKIIEMGKDKGQTLTLEMLLDMANKDINGIDRWISSLSDASDPLLSLIDKAVKVTQSKRDKKLGDLLVEIRGIHRKLTQAGYSNTDFMFERDSEGNITGRLVSDYDFERYFKEREEYIKKIKDAGSKPYEVKLKIEAWERKHLDEIVVDPDTGRKELVPIYKKDIPLERQLSPAQLEYYNAMIKLKAALENLIPNRYANLYRAVQVRNNTVSAIASSDNPKNAAKQVWGNFKDRFIRRSDDSSEFGESNVLLGFNGKPVDRLPVFYTAPLEDMNRLSLDFTSSIVAYASMAMNYNEMNKIVDVLELTRDLVKERKVQQYSGDKKLAEAFTILHKQFSKDYTKTGENTNIGSRLDDYYDAVVYNKLKKDQGTFTIPLTNVTVDTAKALDAAKEYTGDLGLGLNVFSAMSNIIQGKLQLFIEAIGGEYFNYKNLAVAKKNYYAMLPAYLGELNSPIKTNKLSLLIERFDALEEFYRSLREQGKFQGPMARIFGGASLFFMNNAGEHYLHCRTMLAMLDNYKVKLGDQTISLFDAFEVEPLTSESGETLSAKLKLKDGVTKLDGSKITEDDLINLKLKIGKVNQSLNGAFNDVDKGAIHRGALGRMAMQFRQWMPAHYNRRFARPYYDAAMDQWREGYYYTLGSFGLNLLKDLTHAKFQVATHWSELSNHQKANIRRAATETAIFYALSTLISMMGSVKDKKGIWKSRMLLYNLMRAKVETGAAFPLSTDMLDNMWTILQSPAAAIKTFNNVGDLLQFQNMFNEIQSGRYKGWSEYERDLIELIPVYGQIRKVIDIKDEDYMFNIFK